MLKQILIGGEERPIHFGYGAKRRLDPIIRQMATAVRGLVPADEYDRLLASPASLGILLAQDVEFQIQLLKIGLEEGDRIARRSTVFTPIEPETICDWMDENPEAILEAIKTYGDQSLAIMAKQAGEEPEKFRARVMGEA